MKVEINQIPTTSNRYEIDHSYFLGEIAEGVGEGEFPNELFQAHYDVSSLLKGLIR